MLFVTYWELNENVASRDSLQGAAKVVSSGLFPPPNVTILRWDVTPDNWGILVMDAESAEAVSDAIAIWRAAIPGFFKSTKTAPIMSVQEAIPRGAEWLKALAAIGD